MLSLLRVVQRRYQAVPPPVAVAGVVVVAGAVVVVVVGNLKVLTQTPRALAIRQKISGVGLYLGFRSASPYDDARYLGALRTRKSPLTLFIPSST